ncbi:MAG: succinylglutamate desuccinylase [Acidobacteria bacterium]|nr:MAG: succinylglutamate desuccinylase [Acidobacteriota bacterium]
MMKKNTPQLRGHLILVVCALFIAIAGIQLRRHHNREPVYPSPSLTETKMLSDYHAALKGSSGDTAVYIYDSGVPGGTLLVLGGTHPNEPAGFMTAILMAENVQVTQGKAIIITHANASAFTHCDSQEAILQRFTIDTRNGPRWFRVGSRLTNPLDQWPDPTIYVTSRGSFWDKHIAEFPEDKENNPGPGGTTLAGVDSRNLNRCFPGLPDGTLTEQVAFAITSLILKEKVDLAIDLHEAAPEYPTVNVIVAHQRAEMIALGAELLLDELGIKIVTDTSVTALRGLSHREWGDSTPTHSCLMETPAPSMGRFKGRTSLAQIVDGQDGCYRRAQLIQDKLNAAIEEQKKKDPEFSEKIRKIVKVDIPAEGVPLAMRMGRHLSGIACLVESFNMETDSDRQIGLANLPSMSDLMDNGIGNYLQSPRTDE